MQYFLFRLELRNVDILLFFENDLMGFKLLGDDMLTPRMSILLGYVL